MKLSARFRENPWAMLQPYLAGVACLALACAAVLFFSLSRIRELPVPAGHNATTVAFSIDSVRKNAVSLKISGWALERGEDLQAQANTVVLVGEAGAYALPTKLVRREDVERFFAEDGKKYERSGFFARAVKFFLPKGAYRVFIRHRTNHAEQFVDTGKVVKL